MFYKTLYSLNIRTQRTLMLYFENATFGIIMSWSGQVSILLVISGSRWVESPGRQCLVICVVLKYSVLPRVCQATEASSNLIYQLPLQYASYIVVCRLTVKPDNYHQHHPRRQTSSSYVIVVIRRRTT